MMIFIMNKTRKWIMVKYLSKQGLNIIRRGSKLKILWCDKMQRGDYNKRIIKLINLLKRNKIKMLSLVYKQLWTILERL